LYLENRAVQEQADSPKQQEDGSVETNRQNNPADGCFGSPAEADSEQPPINWDSVLDICGDEAIVREIVAAFVEDTPNTVQLIVQAIDAQDIEQLRLYAHKLKGASTAISATQLRKAAAELENAAIAKDLQGAVAIIEQVKAEHERLISFLSRPDWVELAAGQDTRYNNND